MTDISHTDIDFPLSDSVSLSSRDSLSCRSWQSREKMSDQPVYTALLNAYSAFAYIWGFGGHLSDRCAPFMCVSLHHTTVLLIVMQCLVSYIWGFGGHLSDRCAPFLCVLLHHTTVLLIVMQCLVSSSTRFSIVMLCCFAELNLLCWDVIVLNSFLSVQLPNLTECLHFCYGVTCTGAEG